MPPEIHWPAIALRLALTLVAGALLGMERSRSGHSAGLRTTLLVTMAASVAMIQMNLLLPTNGKPHDSYAVMDLMRLPLGILTGVGFIGAGAIVRKDELILGLTTAATMWYATVVGLCLGGGQVILGSVATVLGYAVLKFLRWFEARLDHSQSAEFGVTFTDDSISVEALRDRLGAAGFRIKQLSTTHSLRDHLRTFHCEVRWPAESGRADIPAVVHEIEHLPGVIKLEWKGITGSSQ
jgi:putative Mg2+ transporter-C (MgtC) family protein